jgi:hypothetical protein
MSINRFVIPKVFPAGQRPNGLYPTIRNLRIEKVLFREQQRERANQLNRLFSLFMMRKLEIFT